jgi:hypothetical protein
MKELTASIWSLRYFKDYIWGQKVTVITDHHNLCWLKSVAPETGQLVRLALLLQDQQVEFKYKSGRMHVLPDCLSRAPVLPCEEDEDFLDVPTCDIGPPHNEILLELQNRSEQDKDNLQDDTIVEDMNNTAFICQINEAEMAEKQRADAELSALIRAIEEPNAVHESAVARRATNFIIKNKVLYKKNANSRGLLHLLVIPLAMRDDILVANHDDLISGHQGDSKTIDRTQRKYY